MARLLTALLLAALLSGVPASGRCDNKTLGGPFLRKILVLYNSESGQTPRQNLFREGFATIANYQGLTPVYRDVVRRPLPSGEDVANVRGIATAFDSTGMPAPEEYLRWLIRQMDAGRKLLVLGGLGALEDMDGRPVDPALPREVFRRLGLDYKPDYLADQARLRYAFKDDRFTGFERPLPDYPPYYEHYRPLNGTTPWVLVERRDKPDAASAMVAVSPAGGLAPWGFINWRDPATSRSQWHLDPFALLERTMDLGDAPVLTPTTASGLRVAISHIDADGFGGFSEVNKTVFCGQVVMDQILAKYDFPVTASVIQAEVDPELAGSPELLKLARKLMSMDNVEPASHTYSHPFYWDPDDKAKAALYRERHGLEQYGFKIEGYYFNATQEILGACRWISEYVAPPDKPCDVVLWSGDCEPTPAQLKMCQEHGILNMNGGDTLYDANANSLFSVSPLYMPLDGAIQVYTGQANDNILTNEWTGPFFGFRNIIETMRRTGSPRRLMPIDVYYHFFSGEKFASVQALRDVYDWVMQQPAAPMFTSRYIRMVQDFVKARMSRRDDGAWVVQGYGECASLRLPAGAAPPDLERSQGVQGYHAAAEGTFVHLAPGGRAVVVLGPGDGDAAHLQWATGVVRNFSAGEKEVRLDFECFGKGRLRLAGLAPGDRWRAQGAGLERPLDLVVDQDGGLTIEPLGSGELGLRRR